MNKTLKIGAVSGLIAGIVAGKSNFEACII